MKLNEINRYIPGTVMLRRDMSCDGGMEFLDKIFFITDGIMLSQVREITGLDGSTLQNWVKRGWVGATVNKKYSKDQLARIMIINMLREMMQLEKIDYLLKFVNGHINDKEDDIISEARLYDYICRITATLMKNGLSSDNGLKEVIAAETENYDEQVSGARRRLRAALEVMVTAYYAALIRNYCMNLLDNMKGGTR